MNIIKNITISNKNQSSLTRKATKRIILFILSLVMTNSFLFSETVIFKNLLLSNQSRFDIVTSNNQIYLSGTNDNKQFIQAVCNSDFSLKRMNITESNQKNDLLLIREGNTIIISGINNGVRTNRNILIDQNPWFDVLSVSLSKFILNKEKNTEFWLFQPGKLEAYKMSATKEANENIIVDKKNVDVLRIKLTLTGILSAFWKMYFYYRVSDGLLLSEKIEAKKDYSDHIVEVIE